MTGQVGGGGYSSTTSRDLTGDEVDTFETIKNTSTEIMGIINNISTSTLWEIVEKKISDLKKLILKIILIIIITQVSYNTIYLY